jgi:hypothetical protein
MNDTQAIDRIMEVLFPRLNPDDQWTQDTIEIVADIVLSVREKPPVPAYGFVGWGASRFRTYEVKMHIADAQGMSLCGFGKITPNEYEYDYSLNSCGNCRRIYLRRSA